VRRICVFCGAAEGARPAYAEAARQFGAELVARGLGLRSLIAHAVRERFVSPPYAGLMLFADTPAELLDRFAAWRAPEVLRA